MSKSSDPFLETADWIGAKLCRDAVWSGDRCNWLGDSFEPVNNNWTLVHRAFGPEFYNGTSGIAYFLAHLFRLTGDRIFRLTAEAALRQSASRLDDVSQATRGAFYTGLTGVAYSFIKAGEIFDGGKLIEKGLKILRDLAKEDVSQSGLDIIAGSAGVIPALLNIHQTHRKDFLMDQAIKHGEHLISTARKTAAGWSWNTFNTPPEQQLPDLTGFSHGTAGIAWALLELHKETDQNRFRVAAEQAIHYERRWFSPEHDNWPDLRDQGARPESGQPLNYMVAWCHGAPGIGLARLRAFQMTGDAAYRDEAEAALRTTTSNLIPGVYHNQNNFSLCHGNAGNAELLIYASAVLGNGEHKAVADQVGLQGIEMFRKNRFPWPCGVNGGGETPNLMLGIAGIGYFYLRLHDPASVPSVLIILPEP